MDEIPSITDPLAYPAYAMSHESAYAWASTGSLSARPIGPTGIAELNGLYMSHGLGGGLGGAFGGNSTLQSYNSGNNISLTQELANLKKEVDELKGQIKDLLTGIDKMQTARAEEHRKLSHE
jgi:hypothetical protein